MFVLCNITFSGMLILYNTKTVWEYLYYETEKYMGILVLYNTKLSVNVCIM